MIFKSENSKITFTNQKSIENINSSYIGNIGFYGFIGFVPIAGLTFFTGSANEGTFNLIFRIVLNLLFLISFYRSSTQLKNFYTNILNYLFHCCFQTTIISKYQLKKDEFYKRKHPKSN